MSDLAASPPALEDVLKFGADQGASPEDQANAIKHWRDDMQTFAGKSVTDPVAFFKGNNAVDEDAGKAISAIRQSKFNDWRDSNFGDDKDKFTSFYQTFTTDPKAAKIANPEAADQLEKIISDPAYHFTPRGSAYVPITGSNGATLGSYNIQQGTEGRANVLVGIQTPDGKNFDQSVLKVPVITDDDLQKAKDAADEVYNASEEESRGSDSASVLGRAFGFDPSGSDRALQAKTAELKARSNALDSPQGRAILQHEKVMEAFSKSPLADKATQWGIGDDLVRGFQSLRLGTQYAFANIFGSNDTEKKYREAIGALSDAYPGTNAPGSVPQTMRSVFEMGGQMPALAIPYVGPGLMAASAYGEGVADAKNKADAADATAGRVEKQDPALAGKFRDLAKQMRSDAQSNGMIQGSTMALAGKLIPEAKTLVGSVARGGAEFAGINTVTGLASQATTGQEFEPIKILEGLVVGGATSAVMHPVAKALKKTEPPATPSEAKDAISSGFFVPPAEAPAVPAESPPAEAPEPQETPGSTTVQVNTGGLSPPPEPKAGPVNVVQMTPPGVIPTETPPAASVVPPVPELGEAPAPAATPPVEPGTTPPVEPTIPPYVPEAAAGESNNPPVNEGGPPAEAGSSNSPEGEPPGAVPNGTEPPAGPPESENPPPPVEPPSNAQPIDPAEEVRLAHADEAARAVARGDLPIENVPQGTKAEWQELGRQRFLAGDGQRLVQDLTDHPRAPNPVEHFTLMHYAGDMEAKAADADRVLSDPDSTEADRETAGRARDVAEAERERIAISANRGGSAAGAALGVRAMSLKRSEIPSFPQMIADAMKLLDPTYQTKLAPEQREQIRERYDKLKKASDDLQQHQEDSSKAAAVDDNAKLLAESQAEVESMRKQLADALNKPKGESKPRFTKRVVDSISEKADAARERLRSKGVQFNTSLLGGDPASLAASLRDYSIIMAEYIAKGADAVARMVGDFGETIKPHLGNVEKMARQILAGESKLLSPDEIKAKFKERLGRDDSAKIGRNLARDLAKAHIRDHIDRGEELTVENLDRLVHEDLKEFEPDLTLTQSRDLRTGYGKQSFPSDHPVDIQLRDLNRQAQLLSSLERAEKDLRPLKSGPQRDKQSAKVRNLQKQLNDVMARHGITAADPGTELAGRRDAIRTRLTNDIEDLNNVIAGHAKARIDRPGFDWDHPDNRDLRDMRDQRDALKKIVDAMPENVDATEKQKNAAALKAAEASAKEWDRRAKELDFSSRKKPERPVSPEVTEARRKAQESRDNYQRLKKAAEAPARDIEKAKNKAAADIRAAEKSEREWKRRTDAQDFADKKKAGRAVSPEVQAARDKANAARKAYDDLKKAQAAHEPAAYFADISRKVDAANKRIAGLEAKIRAGDLSVKPGSTKPSHPELDAKRAEVEKLNKALDKMRSAAEAPAREIEKAKKKLIAAKKAVADLEAKIAKGDLSLKSRKATPASVELQAERAKLKALNKEMAKARNAAKLKPSEAERARKRFTDRVTKRIADLRMRRLTSNFESSRKKSSLVHDTKTRALEAVLNQELHEYNVDKERARLASRKKFEKAFDTFSGVNRGFKLSRIATLAKLFYYSMQNLISMPVKELVGGALAHTPGLRDLSKGADIEGGFNGKALAKFYGGFFGAGAKDALQTLSPVLSIITRGKFGNALRRSDLKNAHDTLTTHLEPHWYDIPQLLHEAEKAPLRRGAYEYAKQKLTDAGRKAGADLTNEDVRKEIERRAYQHSDRVVLMADNRFAKGINDFIKRQELPDKETKEVSMRGKAGAAVLRTFLTFNKVASNHFVEFFNHAFGVPAGLVRLGLASHRGLDTLHPEDLNSILRQIKAGTPGLAMLTLGAIAPGMFGGLNPSRKKKGDEPGFGEIKIGGVTIPHNVSHATPYLLVAQLGATMRHAFDEKARKSDKETQGLAGGLGAAARGISRTGPVVSELSRLTKLLDEHQGNNAFLEWMRNNFEPGFISEAAEYFDKDLHNETIRRKAATLSDELKIGIPGLRQQVPKAKPKK